MIIAIALFLLVAVYIARLVLDAIAFIAIKQELNDLVGEVGGIVGQLRFAAQQPAELPRGAYYGYPPLDVGTPYPTGVITNLPNDLTEPIIIPPKTVKLPNDVLDYINSESEEWARNDRYRRALELYSEHDGNWQFVLQELRRDDGDLAENPV